MSGRHIFMAGVTLGYRQLFYEKQELLTLTLMHMKIRTVIIVLSILCHPFAIQAQTVVLSEDFEGGSLGTFSAGTPVGTLNWNNTQLRGWDPGHSAT